MRDFISEDDLLTFEGWLRSQAVDISTTPTEELALWRRYYDETRKQALATPKVGLISHRPIRGEDRYAIAVKEDSDLWLALWMKRSPKGEFFVMIPVADRRWDPHTSYHLDGTIHNKSFRQKSVFQRQEQPLTDAFKGTVHLGIYGGYAPKSTGAVCEPSNFSGVVEIESGILGPRDGSIALDLVEPGCEPISHYFTRVFKHQVFKDTLPWIVVTVGQNQR